MRSHTVKVEFTVRSKEMALAVKTAIETALEAYRDVQGEEVGIEVFPTPVDLNRGRQ